MSVWSNLIALLWVIAAWLMLAVMLPPQLPKEKYEEAINAAQTLDLEQARQRLISNLSLTEKIDTGERSVCRIILGLWTGITVINLGLAVAKRE